METKNRLASLPTLSKEQGFSPTFTNKKKILDLKGILYSYSFWTAIITLWLIVFVFWCNPNFILYSVLPFIIFPILFVKSGINIENISFIMLMGAMLLILIGTVLYSIPIKQTLGAIVFKNGTELPISVNTQLGSITKNETFQYTFKNGTTTTFALTKLQYPLGDYIVNVAIAGYYFLIATVTTLGFKLWEST